MKTFTYKIFIAALLVIATSLTSCDLDVEPTGTVTEGRAQEIGRLEPFVSGLFSWMVQLQSMGSSAIHSDFGHLATMLSTDLMNEDMLQNTQNYGWFYSDYDFSIRPEYESSGVYMHWNYYYKMVKGANRVVSLVPDGETDETLLQYKAQGLAMRAFAYLYLVQLYQHTYVGHQNDLAVPIVTDKTTDAQKNSNPRATVQQVYDLILSDLQQAYTFLENYVRPSKVRFDKQVVAGLLARAYLNMENGEQAANYANIARQGYVPSITQWSYNKNTGGTGFTDIKEPDWMWGADITSETPIAKTAIANPTSHLSSISYGYATAGNMQKMIDAKLYEEIPSTDVRYNAFAADNIVVNGYPVPKYANLKFGYYQANSPDNFGDYVFMRASEMYLIEAEGLMLQGKYAESQLLLHEFVKTRNPKAVKSTKQGEELRKEIYMQRRIELWGEGFSYFDHKRLKLGINRSYVGSNHRENAKVDYLPEANVFRFRIPRAEMNNNPGITENNP